MLGGIGGRRRRGQHTPAALQARAYPHQPTSTSLSAQAPRPALRLGPSPHGALLEPHKAGSVPPSLPRPVLPACMAVTPLSYSAPRPTSRVHLQEDHVAPVWPPLWVWCWPRPAHWTPAHPKDSGNLPRAWDWRLCPTGAGGAGGASCRAPQEALGLCPSPARRSGVESRCRLLQHPGERPAGAERPGAARATGTVLGARTEGEGDTGRSEAGGGGAGGLV